MSLLRPIFRIIVILPILAIGAIGFIAIILAILFEAISDACVWLWTKSGMDR